MRRLILLAALALSACQTAKPPAPVIQVVEKQVPVPVPCISGSTPDAPDYPDSDQALKAADGAAARYGLIAAGRVLRIQRLSEIEPQIARCRR